MVGTGEDRGEGGGEERGAPALRRHNFQHNFTLSSRFFYFTFEHI